MFSLNETNRFYVYTHGIDMRKGVESLCGIVRNNCMNPLSGSVFLFANKSKLAQTPALGTGRFRDLLQKTGKWTCCAQFIQRV